MHGNWSAAPCVNAEVYLRPINFDRAINIPPTPITIQCKGITNKGERCRRNTIDGYCHLHAFQQRAASPKKPKLQNWSAEHAYHANKGRLSFTPHSTPHSRPPSPSKSRPGYIYVYTLTSLLDGTSKSVLVKNIPGTSSRNQNKLTAFNARKLKYMLIKVGMTTGTVANRLHQWELQCGHRLTCLEPGTKPKKSLLDALSLLSLKTPSYKTFDKSETGFWCSRSVLQAETHIHALLRAKYGKGEVQCGGCKKAGVENGIHVEWFLIPKLELQAAFAVIDTVCRSYN